jgi:hypothetical protein
MAKKKAAEETTSAIVKTEPAPIAKVEPSASSGTQLGNFDSNEFVMPRMKLVQPTSADLKKEGADEGKFWDMLSGSQYDTIDVIPLSFNRGRSLWRRGEKQPLCGSMDGILPDLERFEEPHAVRCCDRKGPRLVPLCPEAQRGGSCKRFVDLIALMITKDADGNDDRAVPFTLRLTSYSIPSAKDFHTWCSLHEIPYHDVRITLASKPETNDLGDFFSVQIRNFVKQPAGLYSEFAEKFAGYDVRKTDAAEAAGSDEDDDDGFAG